MKKTLLVSVSAALIILIGTSTTKKAEKINGITGYTGGCSCHTSSTLGNIAITGIPTSVTAGQSYPLNVVLTDAAGKIWGFDMIASIGSFTKTNSLVNLNGSKEVYHNNAPLLTAPSYTFSNITWTAPATAGSCVFKFAGVAGNANGSDKGDHAFKGNFTTSVTLPVELTLFDAKYASSNISLNWQTASELNTDHFEIERSTDKENFELVGKVAAVGNATTTNKYTFTDNTIKTNSAVYYRLKIVDKDGSFNYSSVRIVLAKSLNAYITNIYPNPLKAGQDVHVQYVASTSEKISFVLYNTTGRKLNSIDATVENGTTDLTLKLGHFLAPGVYFLAVESNDHAVQKISLVIN